MVTASWARKPRTALLLVDFINHFRFDGGKKLATRAVPAARNAARLKAKLRARGYPCIYANDNFGEWNSEFSGLIAECERRPGPSADIVGVLRPAADDICVLKPRHSAFYGTPLDFLLQELGVTTLVIAGIAVDMCVMATAHDAHVRQFKIRVPENCIAGFSKAQERAALTLMARTMNARTQPYQAQAAR